jgi:hypothetical protein
MQDQNITDSSGNSQTCCVSLMVVQYIIVDPPSVLLFETSFTSSSIKDIVRLHDFTP